MILGKINLLNNQTLNTLSKFFALISACLAAYILVRIVLIQKEIPVLHQESMDSKNAYSLEKLLPTTTHFSEYSQIMRGQSLFQLPKEKKTIDPNATPSNSAKMDLKNFKVLGVMLSKSPTVIIQNVSAGNTQILSIGDKLNDLNLMEIQKNKIIFEHEGQKVELPIEKS